MRLSLPPALALKALSALLPLPAPAQQVDTDTPAGPARFVKNPDGTRDVMIGTTRVDLPDNAYLAFFEARIGNLLLVLYSPGGNACNGYYTWVHATPGDIRRSDSFGTCAEATDISWDAETVRVTMASLEPGRGRVTFVYDGRRPVWKEYSGPVTAGMAPGDWDFWIGRYPFEFVEAAELQDPLRALMGEADLRRLQERMGLAGPMERDGEWIVGAGCIKASCESDRAAVAVNRGDGRLLVALRSGDGRVQLWGRADGAMPAAITRVMAGN